MIVFPMLNHRMSVNTLASEGVKDGCIMFYCIAHSLESALMIHILNIKANNCNVVFLETLFFEMLFKIEEVLDSGLCAVGK
jgi:hypothetical protein